MTQITYRANLSISSFPLISSKQPRTVIVPQADQTFVIGVASEGQSNRKLEIPSAYYMENVVPTAEGYKSIAYNALITSAGFSGTVIQILDLIDSTSFSGYFAFSTNGNIYKTIPVLSAGIPTGAYTWALMQATPAPLASITQFTLITNAFINGTLYIYVSGIGCYRYDTGTQTLVSQTLTALTPSAVLGITSSYGYMVAWTEDSIAWSSTISPTDFTPSLITGAGGGVVQEAKGPLSFCFPVYQGFIIYTSNNIVSATFSGNARYPFTLRELVGSGGVTDRRLVAFGETGQNHYAYTTSGLQGVTLREASGLSPEITDFLAGGYIERFDATSATFSIENLTRPMAKKLSLCNNRYLVISYGTNSAVNSYEYAIIFDLLLQRYGKLKLNHVWSLPYNFVNNLPYEIFDNSQKSVAFVRSDNSVVVLDLQETNPNRNGLILLGKYQYERNHLLQLISCEAEEVREADTFSIQNLLSVNGKTQTLEQLTLGTNVEGMRKYLCRHTGINHTLMLQGVFDLNTLILTFWSHGRR